MGLASQTVSPVIGRLTENLLRNYFTLRIIAVAGAKAVAVALSKAVVIHEILVIQSKTTSSRGIPASATVPILPWKQTPPKLSEVSIS